MSRIRKILILIFAALAAALAVASPAAAAENALADSDAPAGAGAHWLPDEEWVSERWMPYAVEDLYAVLQTRTGELQRHLKTASLDALIRQRGLDPDAVLDGLMAPVRDEFPDAYDRLRGRAQRTFTQRHLMQHMLFHSGHNRTFGRGVRRVLGIGWPKIKRLIRQGMDVGAMATHLGLDPAATRASIWAAVKGGIDRGVARHEMPRRQAATIARAMRQHVDHLWQPGFKGMYDPTGVVDQALHPRRARQQVRQQARRQQRRLRIRHRHATASAAALCRRPAARA